MSDETPAPFKIRMLVRYDGTHFEGWQRQAPGKPTIQGTLESALSEIMVEPIVVVGSGRTDTGVHSEGQTAHFYCKKDPRTFNFLFGVNTLLPQAIAIQKAWLAPEDFHAQRSAIGKTYRYQIHNSRIRDPLRSRYHAWFKKPMDVHKLNAFTEYLIGEHDFKSFQTGGSDVKTTVRKVTEAFWERRGDEIYFQITGTGFLKQMVRNIVGTIVHLEQKEFEPDAIKAILAATDRQKAWGTAPASGLFLQTVIYPPDLDIRCLEI